MSPARSSRDRALLAAGILLVVLVLWGYYAYGFLPVFQDVMRVGREVREARIQLREIEQAIREEGRLRQAHQQVADEVANLHTGLLKETELPTLMNRLSEVASQTGVRIQLIAPQRAAPEEMAFQPLTPARQAPSLYQEIPIQIEALAGFHQLGAFLSRIETGDQPMQVRSLQISQNAEALRRHLVKMTLLAYLRSSETAPPTGQAVGEPRGS